MSTHSAFAEHVPSLDIRAILPALLQMFSGVESCTLARLRVPPVMQHRVPGDPPIRSLVRKALYLRDTYGFPFWDGLLLRAEKVGTVPKAVLDGATFHQPIAAAVSSTDIGCSDVTATLIDTAANDRSEGEIVVILSSLRLRDGSVAHIPMLDFALPPNVANNRTVGSIIKRLEVPGIILSSGNSYHFYGYHLVDDKQLRRYLGRALLVSPLVDHRWVAHQLVEGRCALRVSPNGHPESWPRFIAEVSTI